MKLIDKICVSLDNEVRVEVATRKLSTFRIKTEGAIEKN